MAEPIVFINSDMASYISGERRIVDYGCTAEEVAGIKPVGTVIDLSRFWDSFSRFPGNRAYQHPP